MEDTARAAHGSISQATPSQWKAKWSRDDHDYTNDNNYFKSKGKDKQTHISFKIKKKKNRCGWLSHNLNEHITNPLVELCFENTIKND